MQSVPEAPPAVLTASVKAGSNADAPLSVKPDSKAQTGALNDVVPRITGPLNGNSLHTNKTRRSTHVELALLLSELVRAGLTTIAFCKYRKVCFFKLSSVAQRAYM